MCLIRGFSLYENADWPTLNIHEFISFAFSTVLVLVYMHFMLKAMIKVVDQSIAKELNTHR